MNNIHEIIAQPWLINQGDTQHCGVAMIIMHLAKYNPAYLLWLDANVVTPPPIDPATHFPLPPPAMGAMGAAIIPPGTNPTVPQQIFTDVEISQVRARLAKRRYFNFPGREVAAHYGEEGQAEEPHRDWYLTVALTLLFKIKYPDLWRTNFELYERFTEQLGLSSSLKLSDKKLRDAIAELEGSRPVIQLGQETSKESRMKLATFAMRKRRIHGELSKTSKAGHLPLQPEGVAALMQLVNIRPTQRRVERDWHMPVISALLQDMRSYIRDNNPAIFQNVQTPYNQFWTNVVYNFIISNMPPSSGAFVEGYVLRTNDSYFTRDGGAGGAAPAISSEVLDLSIRQNLHGVYFWRNAHGFVELWGWGRRIGIAPTHVHYYMGDTFTFFLPKTFDFFAMAPPIPLNGISVSL